MEVARRRQILVEADEATASPLDLHALRRLQIRRSSNPSGRCLRHLLPWSPPLPPVSMAFIREEEGEDCMGGGIVGTRRLDPSPWPQEEDVHRLDPTVATASSWRENGGGGALAAMKYLT